VAYYGRQPHSSDHPPRAALGVARECPAAACLSWRATDYSTVGGRLNDRPLSKMATFRQKRQGCKVFPCCLHGLAGLPLAQAPCARGHRDRLFASRSCRECRSGRAWDGDYTQAKTPITGSCRPVPVGHRRPGIDHLCVLSARPRRCQDRLWLCDSGRAGFAAGQL
jgi:hypothetical protein